MGNQSEDLDVEGASARATLRRQPRLRTTREGEIFFSDAIRRGARALSRSLGEMAAEREATLAALLAEIDADSGGESVPTASGSGDLRLGDDLDITTTDRTEDAFKQLLDGEAGLDVELIKYADHDVVRNIMRGEAVSYTHLTLPTILRV